VLAQTLATRAYQALNRVCVGEARRARFKSRGRGLSSIENKRNDTGVRCVLETSEEGNHGYLIWKEDQLVALIDWRDPVVKYGLEHRIKYARLLQRKVSSPQAQGADACSFRYWVQLALKGTIILEKISYKAWQKQYGKSVGLRAPGMFIEMLRRTVASTGGTLIEVSTRTTKLSQYCHGCGQCEKKPLSQRWHQCACGIGPVQRDLYSAFLAAYLDPAEPTPSCAEVMSLAGKVRRRACGQHTSEPSNARMRGKSCPKALVSPEPERVCPKVGAKPYKSCFSSPGRKSRSVEAPLRTPRA
jgi:hypothetical protein